MTFWAQFANAGRGFFGKGLSSAGLEFLSAHHSRFSRKGLAMLCERYTQLGSTRSGGRGSVAKVGRHS